MSTARLPTRDADARPAQARRAAAIELVDLPRKPPPAPATLKAAHDKAVWRELFSEPIADLWRPADRALVLRLVLLRKRLDSLGLEAPTGVYSAVQALEDRLLLNPRARRAAGVVYVPPAPTDLAKASSKVRPIDERRRARIARGA